MGESMKNILILEDEVIIALSIKQTIKANCDAHVHASHDSATAFNIAYKHSIDLLIADIDIGEEIDGIDVAKHLYELYDIPVLFLTSHSDTSTLKRVSKLKEIGYLIKPFREKDLITQIRLVDYQYAKEKTHFLDLGEGYSYSNKTKELLRDNEHIRLTVKEHQLFLALLNAKGNVMTYTYIDTLLWPGKVNTTGVRRQLIYRLKRKLTDLRLESVKDIGYFLNI